MQYHNIKIVPIDIDPFEKNQDPALKVNIDKVRNAITAKTVSVLIVHPFGLVCMDDEEMYDLKQIVNEESKKYDMDDEYDGTRTKHCRIEIWEDCAECYTGGTMNNDRLGYNGSPYVDVQFFSFGMIKTATALGGGIVIIREHDNEDKRNTMNHHPFTQRMIVDKMKRLQQMTYDDQSRMDYFIKVCKAMVLHFLSQNLIILGIIVRTMQVLGLDYDHFVTSSVKGFPSTHSKSSHIVSKRRTTTAQIIEENELRARNLVKRLRKRPCTALLLLLQQRIRKARQTRRIVKERMARCKMMTNMCKENIPAMQLPTGSINSCQHLFWLFPIMVDDPDGVCKQMKKRGYDVPRGTSQLGCVSSFIVEKDNLLSCPNTKSMMDRILYLPIASTSMTKFEMEKMTLALKDSIVKAGVSQKHSGKRHLQSWEQIMNVLPFGLLFILDGLITKFVPYSREVTICIIGFVKVIVPLIATSVCCILAILHILRMTMGRYYINCSNAFAKYNAIRNESSPIEQRSGMKPLSQGFKRVDCKKAFEQSSDIFESRPFELPKPDTLLKEDRKKLVLLTGGTGFIGSLLLRELLFHRLQLNIDGVVLICRSKRKMSAAERVGNLLRDPMYSFLNEKEKEDLVITIEGDVAAPNVGMSESDMLHLTEELNITHVFNCAACVKFTEPLEIAAESNITSALQLQQLTKRVDAKYVYLSTAFIHGNQNGTYDNPLMEKLFDFGRYNPLQLYQSMMGTQSCASKAMYDLGFPNTYTFSKSICEHLLMNEKSVETIIIRPSIVGPALQHPYEGWAGEKPSTLVAGACLYMKNPFNLWTFRRERAPVIPVDVVCRFVLAKSFDKPTCKSARSKSCDDNSNSSDESHRSSELSYVFTKSSTMNSGLSSSCSSSTLSEISSNAHQIYTAAWSTKSPKQTGFLWYDFACAIVQLSSVNGHVELSIAYFVLLISFRIFLAMNLTLNSFQKVHKLLVQTPFHVAIQLGQLLRFHPKILRDLQRVNSFLDLPLLFYPFTTTTFHFSSELVAPSSVNGERYMFSCILAAENFAKMIGKGKSITTTTKQSDSKNLLIGGKRFKRGSSDTWWAITQPRGSYVVRLIGIFVSKLLNLTATEVTVDMSSLSNVARSMESSSENMKPYIILAPTHRSYLDFILLSFVTFSVPEIGIPIPHIAAADDFARIPFIGFVAQLAGAFFVSRGKGSVDPGLKSKVDALKARHSDECPTCIEVFLEGKRSRDRRFLRGKTGFLR